MNADRFFWYAMIIALGLFIGEMMAITTQREESKAAEYPGTVENYSRYR